MEYQMEINNDSNELPFWMMLAHMPRWRDLDTNRLAVSILLDKSMKLSDFFSLSEDNLQKLFNLSDSQVKDIKNELSKLEEYQSLFSELQSEGISIVTLNSPQYSKQLKMNLKMAGSPLILYCKGNLKLLQNPSIAIVGSRKAGENALHFTDCLARKLSSEGKLVVSGFAKGVDRQSLDSSLAAEGQSIIVLPQGILTFKSTLKQFKNQIADGDLLVLSTYHPKAKWSTGLAMGRNAYIYGLSSQIYVAQTENSGGTWSGATQALKKNRQVFIYYSKDIETSALKELIKRGAHPIDCNFNLVDPKNILVDPTDNTLLI